MADTAQVFRDAKIPTQLKTRIAMEGVPESMAQARALVKQYDLTPREKRTTFELLGYDVVLDRAERINKALDYAARDRRAKITIEMDREGYQTRGGLQEFGGTTSQNRRRAGGGI